MNPTRIAAVEGDCPTIEMNVVALNAASGSGDNAGK